jgi:hypothetical protein
MGDTKAPAGTTTTLMMGGRKLLPNICRLVDYICRLPIQAFQMWPFPEHMTKQLTNYLRCKVSTEDHIHRSLLRHHAEVITATYSDTYMLYTTCTQRYIQKTLESKWSNDSQNHSYLKKK